MALGYLCTGFIFSSSCKTDTDVLDGGQSKIKPILVILESYSKWHLGVNRGDDCKL